MVVFCESWDEEGRRAAAGKTSTIECWVGSDPLGDCIGGDDGSACGGDCIGGDGGGACGGIE